MPAEPAPRPRVAYLDLDGTVTRDGSLFHGEAGVTLSAALALARLHDAGVEIVPCSGRTVPQLAETARMLGARTFIAELGSAVAYADQPADDASRAGAYGLFRGRVVPAISGAPDARAMREAIGDALLAAFPDLEWHTPWSEHRRFTLLLRGHVDVRKAREWLARQTTPVPLTLIDNGQIAEDGTHAYHVLPDGASKAAGIAGDRRERALPREACVSFGDSVGDTLMAREVHRHYWIGGPAPSAAPRDVPGNVTCTRRAFGDGLLDAVTQVLAPGRTMPPARTPLGRNV